MPRAPKVALNLFMIYMLSLLTRFFAGPFEEAKDSPPTTYAIVTPRGTGDRREVAKEDAPPSRGKSIELREVGVISPSRGEDSPAPKKRKTSDPEPDGPPFMEKTSIEKAALFDSVVKRFITRTDIKVIHGLSEEDEVDLLHSSWIDVSS